MRNNKAYLSRVKLHIYRFRFSSRRLSTLVPTLYSKPIFPCVSTLIYFCITCLYVTSIIYSFYAVVRECFLYTKRKKVEVNFSGLSGDFSQSNVQGVQVRPSFVLYATRMNEKTREEDAIGIHNKYRIYWVLQE